MPLKKLVAGLSLCLCCNALFAADSNYEGVVKDDSGQPLEFANVTLLSLNDSTLIDGTVTDMSGRFVINCDSQGVLMRITAMGFEDKTISNPEANAGEIILSPPRICLARWW